MLYIPKGVAHGFYGLRRSFMTYLVDEYYDNSDEHGAAGTTPRWHRLGRRDPIVSGRDQENPALAKIPANELPE